MTEHADKLDAPVPGLDTSVKDKRTKGVVTRVARSRRHRQAMITFSVATIAYVAFKLPPYLSFDSRNSPIPPEHALHFALLSGHAISGSIALLTAVLQLWPWLRRKYPAAHRISGRIYIFAGALPSAVLAVTMYPVTPGAGRVAVLVAATLWSTTSILGWMAARQKRFAEHRRWMVYSFAIMWGYGVWVFVIANVLFAIGLNLSTAMETARWVSWTGNLLIAHWWLERTAGRTIIGVARRSPKLKVATRVGAAPR
jgi:hypothetical protein